MRLYRRLLLIQSSISKCKATEKCIRLTILVMTKKCSVSVIFILTKWSNDDEQQIGRNSVLTLCPRPHIIPTLLPRSRLIKERLLAKGAWSTVLRSARGDTLRFHGGAHARRCEGWTMRRVKAVRQKDLSGKQFLIPCDLWAQIGTLNTKKVPRFWICRAILLQL